MDNRKSSSNPSPRLGANFLSVLTWVWTISLFKKGCNKVLGIEDLYDPISSDRSSKLGDRLQKQWIIEVENAKRKNGKPSLVCTIFRTFSSEICLLGFIGILFEIFAKLVAPQLLGEFLLYFKLESEITFDKAICFAIGIVAINLFCVVVIPHFIFFGLHIDAKIKAGICSLVYRKALRLSCSALNKTAPGKIVNLLSSDVNRFNYVFVYFHYLWLAPIFSIIIFVKMYSEIGWSVLIGYIIMLVDVPFQSYMGKLSSKFRLQTSMKTDERVRLMDEIISGVQVIKMYAWEKPFCALIELARQHELKIVRKSAFIKGIFMTSFLFNTRMAICGTFITMILRGQTLTTDKIFVYMWYFTAMSIMMSYMFVRAISEMSECRVSLQRLRDFLLYDEFLYENITIPSNHDQINIIDNNVNANLESDTQHSSGVEEMQNGTNEDEKADASDWSVRLKHVTAKWDSNSLETILNNVDLKINKGKLYIVIGMVGSGKSSLIASILGELTLTQGSKMIKGRVSFADQDAWVFGSTVRQNIIFGQEFDKKRYQKVVKVCALEKDFQRLPHKDHTIVGERGSSLSGGQKARINLARAVYRKADIYILDDPLSAVDAHVCKHLFNDCIQKYLAGKTRILATHQLQYLKEADAIILLHQRKLYQFSDYNELLRKCPEYRTLIAEEEVIESTDLMAKNTNKHRRQFSLLGKSTSHGSKLELFNGELLNDEIDTNDVNIYETTSRGVVEGSLFVNYIKSSGNGIFVLIVPLLFLATQFCVSLNDWFIPLLGNEEESRISLNSSSTQEEKGVISRDYYMYIYATIVLSILLVGLARAFTFYNVCLKCSQRLHNLVFSALIRAPVRFFDTNPSGRILNRFSRDFGSIDEVLPFTILDASQCMLITTGALIVTCTVNFFLFIPILIIGGVFYCNIRIYLKTSKNMKRVEGITRAPIFTHLNATLNGIATIRACQAQSILEEEFDRWQDAHISAWYMFNTASTGFGFSLDFLCFIFSSLVTFSCLLLKDRFNAGTVGLAITQVMSLTSWLQWGVRQCNEAASELMSVERVLEYTKLEPEPNFRDKGVMANKEKKGNLGQIQLTEPPRDWPNNGRIEFKNVTLHYSDDDLPVLKNLTFTIKSREKVGIVGRTGAGKSSLILALFRLANVKGVIEIDGMDTGFIALEDLRKKISIIPQNPVLFSGTLRYNLDPFDEFSDEHLWKVLEEVELKDAVKLTGNGLDHQVQDRGWNYSTGQRQLICLARAILRNNKVLMLDEATANVDPYTDALIQRTIRAKFAPCTVLTVAHRLNTIMDSEKVLVMDKGQLVEFDHPHALLKNKHGPFSMLVKETGQAMYEQLSKVARDAYFDKRKISP